MYKFEAQEAAPIVGRSLDALLQNVATRGRSGADLRRAVGDLKLRAEELIQKDQIGPPLDECFELARLAGATLPQIDRVRQHAMAERPATVGATLIRDAIIYFALAAEGHVLSNMTFKSRQDVEATKKDMNERFAPMEEAAADDMMQMVFQTMISLHAAVAFYLIERARPLARMVGYRFVANLPSLIIAYRLYDDAGRADELRAENKIVHPAFMQQIGRALSQ